MIKKPHILESALETAQPPANAGAMATFYTSHLVFILYVLCFVTVGKKSFKKNIYIYLWAFMKDIQATDLKRKHTTFQY